MNAVDLKLPRLLTVAYAAGGIRAVERLSEAFGGKVIHIPLKENCPNNHALVLAAGRQVADALCDEVMGGHVEFPKGRRQLQLLTAAAMLANGASHNEVATELDISWRHARRLKKKLKGRGALARALAEAAATSRKGTGQVDLEELLQTGPFAPKK